VADNIMLAVEEPVDVTRCRHQVRGCMETGARCITHDLWDELGRHIHLFLAGVTLDDVIRQRVAGRAALNPLMLEAAE